MRQFTFHGYTYVKGSSIAHLEKLNEDFSVARKHDQEELEAAKSETTRLTEEIVALRARLPKHESNSTEDKVGKHSKL